MKTELKLIACAALAAAMVSPASHANARALMAYPMKGQSAKQEDADRQTCHDWAVVQSGYDPSGETQTTKGTKGATTGAIIGAVVGTTIGVATYGGSAGALRGLGIGVGSGGLIGGVIGKNKQKKLDAKYDTYLRAGTTCLEAKGYQVSR